MSLRQVTRKVCLVGDFSVGKSSLVARYVNHTLSDKYLTTVGVSIKTRVVEINDDIAVKLIIWDIAGEDVLTTATERYLKGANGLVMVADGMRPQTVVASNELLDAARGLLGQVPQVSLINKADLAKFADHYPHDPNAIEERFFDGYIYTSAKTGLNVEYAFAELAAKLV